jgi:hypothetical protein
MSRMLDVQNFSVGDLIGMYLKLFGEFGNRLVALQCRQSDFFLEYRTMIPALSSCHLMLSLSAVSSPKLGKITTYPLVQFSESRSQG